MKIIGYLFVGILLISGCKGFMGEKTDLSFIEIPTYTNNTVAFVPVQPFLEGFSAPTDLLAGYDELLYVADPGSNQIISYDQSGRRLASFTVPGVKALGQTRNLDLIALGTTDTIIAGQPYTLDAVYRIDQKSGAAYGLQYARITYKIVHPFYSTTTFSANQANVRLNKIAVLANDYFYVTRTGPDNNTTDATPIPDDAVLLFNASNVFQTTICISTLAGYYCDYFKIPSGITTLAQPPQSPFVSSSLDFIFTSLAPNTPLKVQYISVLQSENGISYEVNSDVLLIDTSKASGFLGQPNKFSSPGSVNYGAYGSGYIFVTDSEKDSVFLFTSGGLEGVPPPAASGLIKNISVSFGGSGTGPMQFNDPVASVFQQNTLWVLDKGNRRVSRFKLTTDF